MQVLSLPVIEGKHEAGLTVLSFHTMIHSTCAVE